jgi:hypothetical protein
MQAERVKTFVRRVATRGLPICPLWADPTRATPREVPKPLLRLRRLLLPVLGRVR